MKNFLLIAPLVALISITGCATSPDKIQTAYVSPVLYKNYSCDQLASESTRVSHRTNELYSSLKKEADNDTAQMAVGMILFWPALFFLEGGDGPEAAEYAELRGKNRALEDASIQKSCVAGTIQTFPPLPEDAEENPKKDET